MNGFRYYPRFGLRGLLLTVAAAAIASAVVASCLRGREPQYFSREELLSLGNYRSWQLVEGPDRIGPYRIVGEYQIEDLSVVTSSISIVGGQKRKLRIPSIPAHSVLVVCLATKNGEPTYVLFKRHES